MEKKIIVRARAIILNNNKLLVVKHSHDSSFAALPGGHLEWGEDIKECLSREIVEELGINPEIGRLLYVNNFTEKDTEQSVEFFFEVTNGYAYKDFENHTRTHAYELADILWIEPNDLVNILPKEFEEDFKLGKIISDQVRYIHS
ncbi:MAG: NUDIX domain-containing protein [Patescibacteria group bacterium]|nr:NUDIX domain-containing protein [Patescibacteria group bacterium]